MYNAKCHNSVVIRVFLKNVKVISLSVQLNGSKKIILIARYEAEIVNIMR